MSDSHSRAEPIGVAECYDRWSSRYDDDRNPTRDLDALVLRRSSLRVRGRTVLELGAGTGKNTRWQLSLCELHPYRQLLGGRAQFTDPQSREVMYVPAFRHSVSEYVNTAIAAGFTLRHLGEWLEADAAATDPPRLLSLLFDRDARADHPPG